MREIIECETYRVPYLELDDLIVYFETKAAEFNSNSYLMLLFELVVHDSLHKAGLSYASISDNNQFEQMVLCAEGLITNNLILLLH